MTNNHSIIKSQFSIYLLVIDYLLVIGCWNLVIKFFYSLM